MESREAEARHTIDSAVQRLYNGAKDALDLLEPKARRAPASAEGEAYRRLLQACVEFNRWMILAGHVPAVRHVPTVQQVKVKEPDAQSANRQDDARTRSSVPAGGQAGAG